MTLRLDTNLREHPSISPSPKEAGAFLQKCTRVTTPTITICPLRIDAAPERQNQGSGPSALAPFVGVQPRLDQGNRIRCEHLHGRSPWSQLPAKICILPAYFPPCILWPSLLISGARKSSSAEAKHNSTSVFIDELRKMRWRFHQVAGPGGTRSFDCRKPNAATPVAVGDGRSNHLARSVA